MHLESVCALTVELPSWRDEVDSLSFSRDGQTLFVAVFPRLFALDATSGAVVDEMDLSDPTLDGVNGEELDEDERDPDDAARVLEVCESSDGRTLFVRSEAMVSNNGDMYGWVQAHARKGGARLWTVPDTSGEEPMHPMLEDESGVTFVRPSPSGHLVALGSLSGVLFVDPRTGKRRCAFEWDSEDELDDHPCGGAFSPDGARFWLPWAPELRCYDLKKKKLAHVQFIEYEQGLFSYEGSAHVSVRASDGRVSVIDRNGAWRIVSEPDDDEAILESIDGDEADDDGDESGQRVIGALSDGDRWVSCVALESGALRGPVRVQFDGGALVIEEPESRAWTAHALHEGDRVLLARASGPRVFIDALVP